MRRLVPLLLLFFAAPGYACFDSDAFDTDAFDSNAFDFSCSAPSTPSVALSTIFISGSVPSSAVYKAGSAYASTGERYVKACSAPYAYVFGIAHSMDGALCIDTGGTVFVDVNGYGVTQEGEVVADTCEGAFFPNGIPRDASRSVCMTDVN